MSSSTYTQKTANSNKDSQLKYLLRKEIFATNNSSVLAGHQLPEFPSSMMEYKFRHQNDINPLDLQPYLQDMKISSEGHIMTVTGILPDNDIDEHSILAELQKYDLAATFISGRTLSYNMGE